MEEDVEFETMKVRDDLNRFMDLFEETGEEVAVEFEDGEFHVNATLLFHLASRIHEMSHNVDDEGVAQGLHFTAFLIVDLLQAAQMRVTDDFDISYILSEGDEDNDE